MSFREDAKPQRTATKRASLERTSKERYSRRHVDRTRNIVRQYRAKDVR